MEAHSEGVEAAARLLAPALLGEDPRQVGHIERLMDHVVRGHGYAKAAFDAACWDLLGKAVGQPVWMLLGGKLTDGAPLYRPAPQKAPAEMAREMDSLRQRGYRQFQIKVGADWRTDVERIESTTAVAHFAASTPEEFLINTTDLHSYNVESTGRPPPPTRDGRLFASDAPGLGVEPDFDALGEPVSVYR